MVKGNIGGQGWFYRQVIIGIGFAGEFYFALHHITGYIEVGYIVVVGLELITLQHFVNTHFTRWVAQVKEPVAHAYGRGGIGHYIHILCLYYIAGQQKQ